MQRLAEAPLARKKKGRSKPPLSRSVAFRFAAWRLFRGKQGNAQLAAAIELEEILDALLGDVVADHAVALGIEFGHVDIGGIDRLGALGDDTGLEQRLDQHTEDVGGVLHLLADR